MVHWLREPRRPYAMHSTDPPMTTHIRIRLRDKQVIQVQLLHLDMDTYSHSAAAL